jgi:WD40 repeat protein
LKVKVKKTWHLSAKVSEMKIILCVVNNQSIPLVPMTVEDAIAFIEQVVQPKQLNKMQRLVLASCWQGHSYQEMAKSSGYDCGYVKDTGYKLWLQLSDSLGEKVNKQNCQVVLKRFAQQNINKAAVLSQDWGEAIDVSLFYGRSPELTTLQQWLVSDRCRLVTILGMGGIGKTALAVKIAEQVKTDFKFVIWRSLRNAPTIEKLLSDLILFVSHQQASEKPLGTVDEQISLLIKYLASSRCLLVLDNTETILQSGERVGNYRQGYEGYGQLIRRIADERHQSCLVLTSREKPIGLSPREGEMLPVRSLYITGVARETGQVILSSVGLSQKTDETKELSDRYAGNPLALKIAAATIKSLFGGNIRDFFSQGTIVFGDIWDLLEQQFNRLSDLETQIMRWLAIARERVTLQELHADIIPKIPQRELMEVLESLQKRSLIEIDALGCTQQPVVMEYVTEGLVKQFYTEISNHRLQLLNRYALIRASAKDYIREAQIRLILQPVTEALKTAFENKQLLKAHLDQFIPTLRANPAYQNGYAAGNLLNLYWHLQIDMSDARDYSHLAVRQAYLPNVTLHQFNFTHAELDRCVFAETFGGITGVAFSPNNQLLATSDTGGKIHICQVSDGKQLTICRGHRHWAWAVAFSPDGQILASVADDYLVKLWDVKTGNCLETLVGHTYSINTVAFSPDGRTLATSGQDREIRLWDLSNINNAPRILQGHSERVWSVAFSPDGQTLVSGSEDKAIALWDLSTGNCHYLQGHTNWVRSVAFSPDGQTIVSGSYDQTIRFWDVNTRQCLNIIPAHTSTITTVTFSSDGRWVASSSYDQTIKLWDVKTLECKKTFIGHTNRVWNVAFSPDSQQLASGADDHATALWNIKTGECDRTIIGHTNSVLAISLSQDANFLASGHEDQTIRLWNLVRGECCQTIQGHTNRVWSVAFAPQEAILATGSADRTIKLWDYKTGECLRTILGHTSWVWSVVFSPDGDYLASASYDQTIKLWEVKTGICLQTWTDHTASVTAVVFSPDGKQLASSSFDQTVKVWDVCTGQCIFTLQGHTNSVWAIAFSPDGQQLASGSFDQTIRVWNIATGRCTHILTGHTAPITSICYQPIEKVPQVSTADRWQLVSGSFDQTIRQWNLETNKCTQTLNGHTGIVYSLVMSASVSPQVIFSSSFDETIKAWNLETNNCFLSMRSPRPYEGMQIANVKGLTLAQKSTLKALGAVED